MDDGARKAAGQAVEAVLDDEELVEEFVAEFAEEPFADEPDVAEDEDAEPDDVAEEEPLVSPPSFFAAVLFASDSLPDSDPLRESVR